MTHPDVYMMHASMVHVSMIHVMSVISMMNISMLNVSMIMIFVSKMHGCMMYRDAKNGERCEQAHAISPQLIC